MHVFVQENSSKTENICIYIEGHTCHEAQLMITRFWINGLVIHREALKICDKLSCNVKMVW